MGAAPIADRAFPAYAGVVPSRSARRHRSGRVPRVCGGGPSWSPAPPAGTCGVPRVRGDGPEVRGILNAVASRSPRTRGWLAGSRPDLGQDVAFPAYAGVVPGRPTSLYSQDRVPAYAALRCARCVRSCHAGRPRLDRDMRPDQVQQQRQQLGVRAGSQPGLPGRGQQVAYPGVAERGHLALGWQPGPPQRVPVVRLRVLEVHGAGVAWVAADHPLARCAALRGSTASAGSRSAPARRTTVRGSSSRAGRGWPRGARAAVWLSVPSPGVQEATALAEIVFNLGVARGLDGLRG